MNIVVLDGYTLNPGDLTWKNLESLGPCTVYDRSAPEEVVPRCNNPHCPAQAIERMKHFVSRDAMDIESLGEKQLTQLINSGKITDVADLYLLSKEDMFAMDRMGDALAEKLTLSIASSKTQPLSRLLFGLGIRHVGKNTAKILARRFASLDSGILRSTR